MFEKFYIILPGVVLWGGGGAPQQTCASAAPESFLELTLSRDFNVEALDEGYNAQWRAARARIAADQRGAEEEASSTPHERNPSSAARPRLPW